MTTTVLVWGSAAWMQPRVAVIIAPDFCRQSSFAEEMAIHRRQLRLFITAAVIFLFFGLIPALPAVHFNKAIFPGTRHMYTLHLEATANGVMVIALGLLQPFLELSGVLGVVFEVMLYMGVWFNIVPWVIGARNSVVLKLGEGQVGLDPRMVPGPHNEFYVSLIGTMLTLCGVGIITAWAITLFALLRRYFAEPVKSIRQTQ